MAQDLEAGLSVYLNKETLETRAILDWDEMIDTETPEEEKEKIFNEWSAYMVIEKPGSREDFMIMEDFVYSLEDPDTKQNLLKILSMRSPFANFKAEIDSSGYRELWFAFRTKKYEDYVKDKLQLEGIEYE